MYNISIYIYIYMLGYVRRPKLLAQLFFGLISCRHRGPDSLTGEAAAKAAEVEEWRGRGIPAGFRSQERAHKLWYRIPWHTNTQS